MTRLFREVFYLLKNGHLFWNWTNSGNWNLFTTNIVIPFYSFLVVVFPFSAPARITEVPWKLTTFFENLEYYHDCTRVYVRYLLLPGILLFDAYTRPWRLTYNNFSSLLKLPTSLLRVFYSGDLSTEDCCYLVLLLMCFLRPLRHQIFVRIIVVNLSTLVFVCLFVRCCDESSI